MTRQSPQPEEKASSDELLAVTLAWYGLQVQHAHLLQHLAVLHELNPIDLRLLKFLGLSENPATPKELGLFLEVGTGTVTAMIDRLEARNFIVRVPNPRDRRSVLVTLDSYGSVFVQDLRHLYGQALASTVTPRNHRTLIEAFATLEQSLNRTVDTIRG